MTLIDWLLMDQNFYGLLIIFAFLLGMGARGGPNGKEKIDRTLRLLEGITAYLGSEHIERSERRLEPDDIPGSTDSKG